MPLTTEQLVLPFVTTHELDRALGGGDRGRKQRQRLTRHQDPALPVPRDFGRVKRHSLLALPRFAFSGLLRDTDVAARRKILEAAGLALAEPCFAELGVAMAEATRTTLSTAWDLQAVAHGTAQIAPDAMKQCSKLVAEIEAALQRDVGISFRADLGVLEETRDSEALLRLLDGGIGRVRASSVMVDHPGVAVVRETLGLLGSSIELVTPTAFRVEPGEIASMPGDHDLELAEWLADRYGDPLSPPAAVDNGERDQMPDELTSPRWRRRRYAAPALNMTRTPRSAA